MAGGNADVQRLNSVHDNITVHVIPVRLVPRKLAAVQPMTISTAHCCIGDNSARLSIVCPSRVRPPPATRTAMTFRIPALFAAVALTSVSAFGLTRTRGHAPLPEPELVGPGIISTALDELNSAFSPDGQELYFDINGPANGFGTIVVSKRRGDGWSAPVVTSFSGQYTDYDPTISADGKRLIFISNRPVGGVAKAPQDMDLWSVSRTRDGWGEPVNLGPPLNTPAAEYSPSLAADGTLYFSGRRSDSQGRVNIYRSRQINGAFGEPENLGPTINGTATNVDVAIAPDQSFIIFVSYGRPDALGSGDLYISFNRNGQWTVPKNLGAPINSAALEYAPGLSPDGKYLYFTSQRGFATQPLSHPLGFAELRDSVNSIRNGLGNIYRVPLQSVLDANR